MAQSLRQVFCFRVGKICRHSSFDPDERRSRQTTVLLRFRDLNEAARRRTPRVQVNGVDESKACKHATLRARLAPSRFRFNTKTYRELRPRLSRPNGE
jgi:hypothetical protein